MVRWDSALIRTANRERDLMLRRFAENAARHGTDMWVHAAPIEELSMADLPKWRRHRRDKPSNARSDPQRS